MNKDRTKAAKRRAADIQRKQASTERVRLLKAQAEEARNEQAKTLLENWKAQPTQAEDIWQGTWPPRVGDYCDKRGRKLEPQPGFNRTDNILTGTGKIVSWVWWYDAELVLRGFLVWKPAEGKFDLSVDPTYQGRGVGKLLTHYVRTEFGAQLINQQYSPSGAACINGYLRDFFNDVDFYKEYPNGPVG